MLLQNVDSTLQSAFKNIMQKPDNHVDSTMYYVVQDICKAA